MQIVFDPTISLGSIASGLAAVGAAGVFLWKAGAYVASVNSFIALTKEFMKESRDDRKEIKQEVGKLRTDLDTRHDENIDRFQKIHSQLVSRRGG